MGPLTITVLGTTSQLRLGGMFAPYQVRNTPGSSLPSSAADRSVSDVESQNAVCNILPASPIAKAAAGRCSRCEAAESCHGDDAAGDRRTSLTSLSVGSRNPFDGSSSLRSRRAVQFADVAFRFSDDPTVMCLEGDSGQISAALSVTRDPAVDSPPREQYTSMPAESKDEVCNCDMGGSLYDNSASRLSKKSVCFVVPETPELSQMSNAPHGESLTGGDGFATPPLCSASFGNVTDSVSELVASGGGYVEVTAPEIPYKLQLAGKKEKGVGSTVLDVVT